MNFLNEILPQSIQNILNDDNENENEKLRLNNSEGEEQIRNGLLDYFRVNLNRLTFATNNNNNRNNNNNNNNNNNENNIIMMNNENDEVFVLLIDSILRILRHGMKKNLLILNQSLWNVFLELNADERSLRDVLKFIDEDSSELGDFHEEEKIISLIKHFMNKKMLHLQIQTLRENKEILDKYYEPFALIRRSEVEIFLTMLQSLNHFNFKLCLNKNDVEKVAELEKEIQIQVNVPSTNLKKNQVKKRVAVINPSDD